MTLSQEYQDKRKAYLDHDISHEDFYLWVASVIGWHFELYQWASPLRGGSKNIRLTNI